VRVDVLLDTFGTTWSEVRAGAVAAERVGLDGVWLNDHLAGSTQGASHVLECWTVLSALAAEVPRIALGPLVLNVANRDPGTLAVMAATLQHVSGGRLLLGIGAGARAGTPYAIEQEALGRPVGAGPQRRSAVERTIGILREIWSGAVPAAAGFLRPEPFPPIVVAGSGPKMAELAGRVGDGICAPAGARLHELVAVAHRARSRSGPEPLLVTASLGDIPERTTPRLGLDVDRLIVYVAPPFAEAVARLGEIVSGWTTGGGRRV
jgi:alkanesulfonate monooxygenase SsuD/methylene tetrahydromethanopterin reductase-like flavin-dependent oxidoreductase (luciferase family)